MATMSGGDAVPTGPGLSQAGWTRLRQCWSERLSVPVEALTATGTCLLPQDAAGAVVVVEVGGSCVVVGPHRALAHLEDVERDDLFDLSLVVARLEPLRPQPIGTASLSFRDVPLTEQSTVTTRPAGPAMVDDLRRAMDAADWDESGLAGMPHRWATMAPDGHVAALAGFERWGSEVAQLGVAAHPAHRGRGYAAAAATAATSAALADGLVAQWRCRHGHTASRRLATSLGFEHVGRQTTVALG